MKKKIFAAAISAMVLVNSGVCFAYKFPNAFWKMNENYQAAVESSDHNAIIAHGNEIINLMLSEPECEETVSVLADRMQRVAGSLSAVGRYDESAAMLDRFLPYAKKMDWQDSVIIANAKIPQYRAESRIYTSGYASTFFGAKNEPENGILFGVCANDTPTRGRIPNESMILIYERLGENLRGYNTKLLKEAEENGLAVEYALNCPNESWDIDNIRSYEAQLGEISEMFKGVPGTKIFLRFGAEFNVWSNMPTPEGFIDAFRYVADFFHTRNANVALVWSPNQVSSWGSDMHAFYPGDAYVDWIGVSLYSMPYFQGNPTDNDYTEPSFKVGKGADPVLALRGLADAYSKPMMISESGFAHTIKSRGENTTAWALQKMKEFYSYLPMVYPQIKLIAHFDQYLAPEVNDFSLFGSSALTEQYIKETKWPRFIQDNSNNKTTFAYNEVTEGKVLSNMCDLYTYTHLYGEDIQSVTYSIDGVQVGASDKMPFACYVDLEQFENGAHTLKSVSVGSGGSVVEASRTVYIENTDDTPISVTMNGAPLTFDQAPVIYSGRTMVPMRAIFDAMGAQITWDDATKTVTGTRGGTSVSITIGSNILKVNGAEITLDTPAILMSGRTLVPARAIAESFLCNVGWDANTKTVTITE